MKLTLLLLFLFLLNFEGYSQTLWSVKGTVIDSASNIKLSNTSISVLNEKDSVLQKFMWTDLNGSFNLRKLNAGKYILLVVYPGYADYAEYFTLDSINATHNFGRINMLLKAKLLADVIIKSARTPIKLKGDTTEFNAGSFVVEPNAKVEDLLKQLPGIQVDKNGKITAQGQTVTKVLVDGEEFFGDDPTLVTKNIRADMVDKVQLYDKKSDQASFTGIDDGQKTKTINIKLKEDKKNGYFGKASVAGGTDGYYEEQLLYNKFKAKQKFSVYGTLANTGKIGLGWSDNQKFGSSDNLQFGDDGSIYFNGGSGDGLDSFDGQYNGQGIPIGRTGGIHFDSKWNSDKQSINTNYKIGFLAVTGANNTLTQNNLTTGPINSNVDETYNNSVFRQKLDFTYQIKPDSTSNLKVQTEGTLKNTQTRSNYSTTSDRGNGVLLNGNNRNIDNNDNAGIFGVSALYTKKLKKPGRTFSVNVSELYSETRSKGYLKSTTDYYNQQGNLDSLQRIDQYKTNNLISSVLITNLTYTEPLSKASAFVFNYGAGLNNSSSDRKSFNPSPAGVYNIVVDSLSNNFKLNQFSNQLGAIYNYKKDKATFNIGTHVSNVNFNQIDEITGKTFNRDFINWNPQANFQYRFSKQKRLSINYNGSTTQPTVTQIQPVVVNTDPLNIIIGNQNLKPSFTNRINFGYNSYKVLTGLSIYMYGSYNFTTNPIISSLVTDSTGRTTNQYFNLKDKKQSDYNIRIGGDRKIGETDIQAGVSFYVNGSNSYSLSNGSINLNKSTLYNFSLNMYKEVEKKYSFSLDAGPEYIFSGSSLQSQINNNGRGFNAYASFTVYLSPKFMISSDGNYEYKSKTETFNQNFSRLLVNTSLTKTFFKADNLKLSLAGNDLLNQNIGFSRTSNGNLITQNSYTTIKRYFMLSIVWDFNSLGSPAAKK